MNRKALLTASAAAACTLGVLAAPAQAATSTTYMATLAPVNSSGASGSLMMTVTGSTAVVTEHTTGLAATFSGSAYPHVQHIHSGAQGVCPTASADTNGDGVISTTEGSKLYGGISTTLSKSGDTSAASGTNIWIAPTGAGYTYTRTITLDAATLTALKDGTAVVVVHGLDPTKVSKQAQAEKSDMIPTLPLAATSPALCGKVLTSQMTSMPTGGVQTGGGGTAGVRDAGLFGAAGALALGAGGAWLARRRFATQPD